MTADLAAYRTTVDALLATAVDASTWTDAIKDQALRQALAEYDDHFVYENERHHNEWRSESRPV